MRPGLNTGEHKAFDRRSRTILIVEDDPVLALDLMSLLESHGYAVAGVAESGEDALVQIHVHPVDVVLMDVNLSGGGGKLDGVETAAMIPPGCSATVIFVTGEQPAEVARRSGAIPGSTVIAKPYNDDVILQAVRRAA